MDPFRQARQSNILGADGRPYTYPPEPSNGRDSAPPDDMALPHVLTFSALLNSAYRTYYSGRWDEAMKHSRQDAVLMRNDCFLMGLMQERTLAVTSLPWHLEVDDEEDPVQGLVRDHLTTALKMTPRFRGMLKWLHNDGVWVGRTGAQLKYKWASVKDPNGVPTKTLVVQRWAPVNGDKINHTWDHVPTVQINAGAQDLGPDAETVTDNQGKALVLRGTWRDRFLIHRNWQEDTDFFDGVFSAEAVHGTGVRSKIFWWNWLRLERLSQVGDYLERVGLGITLYYYELGNPQSEAAVKKAAKEQSGRVNLILPRSPNSKGQGLERVETPISGAEAVGRIAETIEWYIERYIVGQKMSSGTDSQGSLGGTGRSEFAADTKANVTEDDAGNLAETMTGSDSDFGLVRYLHKHTYPQYAPGMAQGFECRFKLGVKDPDTEKRLKAIQIAVQLGVPVKADDVREAAGLAKPKEGDELCEGMGGGMEGAGESPDRGAAQKPGGKSAGDWKPFHGPRGGLWEKNAATGGVRHERRKTSVGGRPHRFRMGAAGRPEWVGPTRYAFDPAEPRIPKGQPGGGRWTSGGEYEGGYDRDPVAHMRNFPENSIAHEPGDPQGVAKIYGLAEHLEKKVGQMLEAAGPKGLRMKDLLKGLGDTVYGRMTPHQIKAMLDVMDVSYQGDKVRLSSHDAPAPDKFEAKKPRSSVFVTVGGHPGAGGAKHVGGHAIPVGDLNQGPGLGLAGDASAPVDPTAGPGGPVAEAVKAKAPAAPDSARSQSARNAADVRQAKQADLARIRGEYEARANKLGFGWSDLLDVREQMRTEDLENVQKHNTVITHAKKLLAHYGTDPRSLQRAFDRGEADSANVKGLDVVARSMAKDYPEFFAGYASAMEGEEETGDAPQRLLDLLMQGPMKPMEMEEVYEEAMAHLEAYARENGADGDAGDASFDPDEFDAPADSPPATAAEAAIGRADADAPNPFLQAAPEHANLARSVAPPAPPAAAPAPGQPLRPPVARALPAGVTVPPGTPAAQPLPVAKHIPDAPLSPPPKPASAQGRVGDPGMPPLLGAEAAPTPAKTPAARPGVQGKVGDPGMPQLLPAELAEHGASPADSAALASLSPQFAAKIAAALRLHRERGAPTQSPFEIDDEPDAVAPAPWSGEPLAQTMAGSRGGPEFLNPPPVGYKRRFGMDTAPAVAPVVAPVVVQNVLPTPPTDTVEEFIRDEKTGLITGKTVRHVPKESPSRFNSTDASGNVHRGTEPPPGGGEFVGKAGDSGGEAPAAPGVQLSEDENAAVEFYRDAGHEAVNDVLRGTHARASQARGAVPDKAFILGTVVPALDAAIARHVLPRDVRAYRGAKVMQSADPGYASVTTDRKVAEYFAQKSGGQVVEVVLPKGTPALPVGGEEAELLLPRGYAFPKGTA